MLGAVTRRLASSSRVMYNKAPLTSIRGYATAAVEEDSGNLLNLSFICPHRSIFLDKKVSSVTVPGAAGMMGISKNHIPAIAELKPGLVIVDEAGKQDKYFVSGGFTFVNTDKTCVINAVEAVPLDNLDPDAAKSGYTHYLAEHAKAGDEEARAKAQIGLEVHKQMCWALGINV